MPKLETPELDRGGSLKEAFVREDELLFRKDGKLKPYTTRFYLRQRLPVGQVVEGPAVVLQSDSTTLLPPETRAVLESNGNMILTIGAL